ncbi:DNA replication factor Dna2 family protein [Trichinella spiralis]|uniref:DNA replication factor Dna2 family protein n=1 Tax=Trichinella spiralis TaxID=6334 RepID=UPI0001EFE680|nr:DNA replication factor Dna2 family protein [Trichinella spiralis]
MAKAVFNEIAKLRSTVTPGKDQSKKSLERLFETLSDQAAQPITRYLTSLIDSTNPGLKDVYERRYTTETKSDSHYVKRSSLFLDFFASTMQNPQGMALILFIVGRPPPLCTIRVGNAGVFDDSFEELISGMDDNFNTKWSESTWNIRSTEIDLENSTLLRCVDSGGTAKRVWLEEYWSDGMFKEGDKVRAFLPKNSSEMDEFHISNKSGAVILNPSSVVGVNRISNGHFCTRKSVLMEIFKGFDKPGLKTQVGIIAHKMFQRAVKESISDEDTLRKMILEISKNVEFVQNQYYYDIDPVALNSELQSFVKAIAKFVQNFLSNRNPLPGVVPSTVIDRVLAVEEEMISEKFGFRGSIDMTMGVKVDADQKSTLMPFELKTGKVSQYGDHIAQVMLYCLLLSSNNHESCERGLLYYCGGDELKAVDTKMNELNGLLRMRNEVTYYLHRFFDDPEACDLLLPGPIKNMKICRQCPQMLNCCLRQKICDEAFIRDSPWDAMLEAELWHLNKEHVQYVNRWTTWLRMEGTEERMRGRRNSNIDYDEEEEHSTEECGIAMSVQQFKENSRVLTLAPLSNVNLIQMFSPYDQVLLNGIGERTLPIFATIITVELQQIDVQFSRNRKRQLIIDLDEPHFRISLCSEIVQKMKLFCKGLNAEQKSAIVKTMLADDYVLIKGFPGSGKSSAVIALIRTFISNGNSVLVCAYTNSAVDHILLKLKTNYPTTKPIAILKLHITDILRLGPSFIVHPDIRQFTLEAIFANKEPRLDEVAEILSSTLLVGCTCTTATMHPLLRKRTFNLCIIDEATLATEAMSIGPLLAAEKFVLVGDPLQLKPLVQSERARKQGMDISLFSKLEQKYPDAVVTLKRQYRMNREICKLSNQMFYNGELVAANDEVANAFLNVTVDDDVAEEPWVRRCLSSLPEHAVVFLDTSNCKDNSATRQGIAHVENKLEVDLVVKLCQTFSKSGLDDDEIGVMSIFKTQVECIRRSLKSSGSNGIEVNTVDQYQGKDKDVIIVSFVWTKELKRKLNTTCHLLKNARRVNVALTRARKKLILVGHYNDLKADNPQQSFHHCTCKFIKFLYHNGNDFAEPTPISCQATSVSLVPHAKSTSTSLPSDEPETLPVPENNFTLVKKIDQIS